MKTTFILCLLVFASSAYGEIYSWKDSKGITHYTNKADDIPPRYRAKVKTLYQLPKTETSSQIPPVPGSKEAGLQNPTVIPPAQSTPAGVAQTNTSTVTNIPVGQPTPPPAPAVKPVDPAQQSGEQVQRRTRRSRGSRSSEE